MKLTPRLTALWATLLFATAALAQAAPAPPTSTAKEWAFNLTTTGYVLPDQDGYASPTFAADRDWLHLEARYNYENLRTGSLWIGYNFSAGKKVVLSVTPMIGGVFGRTTGVAPGCEASLSYKKIELSISNEYVIDTGDKSGSFYYAWPQLTYSPLDWLRLGLVAQRTKAYHDSLDTQRGFFVGFSHKKIEFTTYIFNVGWADPTAVLEVGFSF
jgi:hypothetical protein